MNIILYSDIVRTHPAFLSPVRVGVLAHLAAFADSAETGTEPNRLPPYSILISPSALAATLTATRAQIENAIISLGKHGLLTVDKTQGLRGEWLIDLAKSSPYMTGDSSLPAPAEVNIRSLMDYWDKMHSKATGIKYMRSQSDYWREQADWNKLYQAMGDEIFHSMDMFFSDIRFSQWNYAFKVFFKSAIRLINKPKKEGWKLR